MGNPYLFIVGCPRSGTTLLQRVVNAHPQIAILPEAHWIYQLLTEATVVTENGAIAPALIPALLAHPKFGLLGISHEQIRRLIGEDRHVRYPSFVSRIFDLYGEMQGKQLVGNKTPGLVRRLDVVHALWPEARIVHLIRDGRDVYLSMKNRPLHLDPVALGGWSEDLVSTAALWWEFNVQQGRDARRFFGSELYCEVRFESLVTSPGEVCTTLCMFLGLPYSQKMAKFYEKRKRKRASDPSRRGLRDWRSQMQSKDIEMFEAVAGNTLEDLGYSRACSHPGDELVQRSTRRRNLMLEQSARSTEIWAGRLSKFG